VTGWTMFLTTKDTNDTNDTKQAFGKRHAMPC